MKKYFIGILIIFTMILVGGSSEKCGATEKLQIVQLNGGEAQIMLPESWSEKEVDGQKMITDASKDIRIAYVAMPLNVDLGFEKFPIDKFSEKDQKDFVDGMAKGFIQNSPAGSTVKSTSIIKLEDGHLAGLMELTYGQNTGSASAVAIIYNQKAYVLMAGSKKQDVFEKNKEKIISYFKTFKVKE